MDRVKGKVAIVTGAARGLGKAQALLLAREGAKVVITDIDETQGKKAAEEIGQEGGEAIFIKHDVSNEQDWKGVIEKTLSEFSKLDVLVNNAGVILFKNIKETTLEEWRWVISVNLDGVFLGTKYAMEAMKKSGGGSIINISSIAGLSRSRVSSEPTFIIKIPRRYSTISLVNWRKSSPSLATALIVVIPAVTSLLSICLAISPAR